MWASLREQALGATLYSPTAEAIESVSAQATLGSPIDDDQKGIGSFHQRRSRLKADSLALVIASWVIALLTGAFAATVFLTNAGEAARALRWLAVGLLVTVVTTGAIYFLRNCRSPANAETAENSPWPMPGRRTRDEEAQDTG